MARSLLKLWNKSIVKSIVAGFLIGIGYIEPQLWPLVLIGIPVFLSVVLQKGTTLRTRILSSYIVGFIVPGLFLGVLALDVLPLDWYGVQSGPLQLTVLGISWVLVSSMLASAFVVFSLCASYVVTHTWKDVIYLPALWVVCEIFSTFVFFVAQWGPGSFLGPHFTMGFVGYLVASDKVLLQAASIGGIYALSFIVFFVGTLIYKNDMWSQKGAHKQYVFVLLALFVVWLSLHGLKDAGLIFASEPHTKAISVVAVSRYVPPLLIQDTNVMQERFEDLMGLVTPLSNIDLIVFPENSSFLFMAMSNGGHIERLNAIGRNGHSPAVIDSTDIRDEQAWDHIYSQTNIFMNNRLDVLAQKQFLLPFGEYMPFLYQFIVRHLVGQELLDKVNSVRGYRPGLNEDFAFINGVAIAVRFCDELMSPTLFQKQTQNGAEVLVNLSSLSWFHGSHHAYENMVRFAKVRAVENGRYLVQSGNMSPAFVIDQYGNVVAQTKWHEAEALHYMVPEMTKNTFYTVSRQLFVYVLILVLVLRVGGHIKQKKK